MEQVAEKQADLLGRAALGASSGSAKPGAPVIGRTLHPVPVEGKVARRNWQGRIQNSTFPAAKLTMQAIPNKEFLRSGISRQSLSCFY